MTDISTVCTDLLSIVGNNRMPIKTKRILIKRGLIAINTYIDLKPNKIYNLKKKKINKILSLLPSIKYNVDLKKILTKEVITDITNFENYPNILFDKEEDDNKGKENEKTWDNCIKNIYLSNNTDKSNFVEAIKNVLPNKEILIGTMPVESEDSESGKSKESLNSYSDTEEESVCEQVSDEDSDESDEDSDESDEDSVTIEDSDEVDKTLNNLIEDLADDVKTKLIIKLTKYKLSHVFKMEAEKNRNMERMEELSIKKLKANNKYKLKKLENKK
jgi:hypothetical protein